MAGPLTHWGLTASNSPGIAPGSQEGEEGHGAHSYVTEPKTINYLHMHSSDSLDSKHTKQPHTKSRRGMGVARSSELQHSSARALKRRPTLECMCELCGEVDRVNGSFEQVEDQLLVYQRGGRAPNRRRDH